MAKASAAKAVQVFVLGTFELAGRSGPLHLSTRRLEALLAWLLLHPGPHARERLAALVWGEASDARARNSLRNGLAQLRKVLGAELFLSDRELVQLNPRFPLSVDALAFRAQAEQFLAALSPVPEQVDLSLYRGELLQDLYDDWIIPEREAYRSLHLDTLLRLTQLMRARSDYPCAIVHAQHVLALDPSNERAHQHLMFCYLATGQRSAALKQFEECRRLLNAELSVEPAAETLALHAWIKQSFQAGPSPAARITNLPIAFSSFVGREREMAQVKLLLQRGRLGIGGPQAADMADTPGLKPGVQADRLLAEPPPGSDPQRGRLEADRLLAEPPPGSDLQRGRLEAVRLLAEPPPGSDLQRGRLEAVRLLTLTGAGGSGKTRLAVQVATDLVDAYEDGVWWVDLAPLADETLVPHVVANALGMQERQGEPLEISLVEALRNRRLLLLLDNCEHLVGACARLAEMLLSGCAHLQVLATSREPLNIGGERVWQVPTLSLPELAAPVAPVAGLAPANAASPQAPSVPVRAHEIEASEAVRLFVERAAAARAGFVLTDATAPAIAQICLRLDGIPLAIELAAARMKVLSPAEIAERVGDRFALLGPNARGALPRQQTLRALFDWSHELLSDYERILFRRLAVFHGGRTLDAALAVCAGDGIDPPMVLDLLGRLVDKSLLYVSELLGQTRYRFLETVRQYAAERLVESGEQETLRERHAAYCVALAETGAEKLRGEEQGVWLNRLEADHDNLRSALAWARAGGRLALGLQLAGALWFFWYLHGDWLEGGAWLEELLADSERAHGRLGDAALDGLPPALLARALHGTGLLLQNQGQLARARQRLLDSVRLWRRLGDERGLARALNGLGEASFYMGRYRDAQASFEESLHLWRGRHYEHGIAVALCNLSEVRRAQGAHAEAHELAHEAQELWQARGDRRGVFEALNMQALNALARGEYAQAQTWFADALLILREQRMKNKLAEILNGLAQCARGQGDAAAARRLSEESLVAARELGGRYDRARSLHNLARVALHAGSPDEADAYLRESLQLSVAGENLPGIALGCMAAAQAALAREQAERAARLLGGAQALLDRIGAQAGEPDRGEAGQTLAAAEALLGPEPFAAAWQAGVQASQAELVAEASS